MRLFIALILLILATSCSTIKLDESWRNPDYKSFNPKNILIIGITPDIESRKEFESRLQNELNAKHINALQSIIVFEKSFQNFQQTEAEIESQVQKLLEAGYDSILISVVKGINENESYSGGSSKVDYSLRKFFGYYLAYQDAYFEQEYYSKYNVFHIETSIYSLEKKSERTLVWLSTYDLIDPETNSRAIKKYIRKVIKTLEKEKLIVKD